MSKLQRSTARRLNPSAVFWARSTPSPCNRSAIWPASITGWVSTRRLRRSTVSYSEIQRRVLGPEHPQTLFAMSGLASAEAYQGKYTAAEALYDQTLEIQRRVLGSEHPETILSMSSLADVYRAQCRYAQADALYRQTLEMQRRVLGPEHPDTLSTLSGFAFSCLRQGKYALAETYAARALTGRQHALGVDHPDTIDSVADLSLVFSTEGKFAQSEPLARQAVEFDRKQRPTIGRDSSPRACWGLVWPDKKNTPKRNRCCSKALAGWSLERTELRSPTATGSSNFTRHPASPRKLPSGESSHRPRLISRLVPAR